jgi:ABC-2 type transport system permease protein
VRPQELAEPPGASAEPAGPRLPPLPAAVARFVRKVLVVVELEVRKVRHDPTELLMRGVQPVLWLLVFGEVFTRTHAIPTGDLPYLDFMAPGILAQSVLFVAIFYGIAVIWERDLGLVHKLIVSPTPRTALVLGKGLSAGVRALSQAVVIYLLALLLAVLLGAACYSTLSLIIACVVKTRERFMGIGQVVTMPLFFASNAIYPISMMPGWLRVLAHANPLTYQVDALRALMLANGTSTFCLAVDFSILGGATVVLVVLAGRLYPTIVR